MHSNWGGRSKDINKPGALNPIYQNSFKKHVEQRHSSSNPLNMTQEGPEPDNGFQNSSDDEQQGDQCVNLMTKVLQEHNQKKYKKGFKIDPIKGLSRVRRRKGLKLKNRSRLGSFKNMQKLLTLEDPQMKDFKYLALAKNRPRENKLERQKNVGGMMTTRSSKRKQVISHTTPMEHEKDDLPQLSTSPSADLKSPLPAIETLPIRKKLTSMSTLLKRFL